MSISYEGVGALCATFAGEEIEEGTVVKASANATVSACAAGESFCGVAAAVSRDKAACSVQLAGFVTLPYSGETVPTVGYCALAADGDGGVSVKADGRSYLAVEVDETAKCVTILL